ncbi:tyrosinase family oxidase copper chaperone [Streptomyces sp. NPDC002467]|uniref:apotyrosinase chaperone MelC1 n=1 Tax=Streptomyces sp. NPDC002467 TaxID=3364647 RepID=UPI0036C042B3
MNMITRRHALAIAAGTVTAAGLTTACNSSAKGDKPASGASGAAGASGKPLALPTGTIDETFEGRRIQISFDGGGGHHSPGLPTIKIDGKELHLMRNADNTWVTIVNHYETFPDPISAARAAVRELQGAGLVAFAPKKAGPIK